MSVILAGTTLVADAPGAAMYGEHRVPRLGSVQDETWEFSIPRADGVGEKTSGKRRRIIEVDVRFFVESFNDTLTALDTMKAALTYGTLTISGLSTESAASFGYCRLLDWISRARFGGDQNGTQVMVWDVTLVFKQVRGF